MGGPVEPIGALPAQEDFDGILASSRDYVEGWYSGDAERMRRCLHPDLTMRTIVRDPNTGSRVVWHPTTAEAMVTFTEEGGATEVEQRLRPLIKRDPGLPLSVAGIALGPRQSRYRS